MTTNLQPDTPPVTRDVTAVRANIQRARLGGRTIGFVPTMGALHRGHLSLIEAARRHGDYTVVSIYVNPTQFGPSEDFAQYPRDVEADRRLCREADADLIFAPSDAEIYPPGDETRVRPGRLANTLCGASRPGHFDGVCTVVAKLFNIVQPDVAYFGQKDAQQVAIIKRMVRDLVMPIRIEVCPLVREPDGLAMSSRNQRLTPENRQRALCLHQALSAGRDALQERNRRLGAVLARMRAVIAQAGGDIGIDYLSLVDPDTLQDVAEPRGRVMLAGAIRLGDVRLIDNLLVDL